MARVSRLFCPKSQIIWELKIAQYKISLYTKILVQGAKFGFGATGLDNHDIRTYTVGVHTQ